MQRFYLFTLLVRTGMISLHILELFVKPPARYPDLYPALFSIFGAGNLVVVFVITILWQHYLPNGKEEDVSINGNGCSDKPFNAISVNTAPQNVSNDNANVPRKKTELRKEKLT